MNLIPSSFRKQPIQSPQKEDNCRIRIKKTAKGKEIEFKGNCSKEQIAIAKENLGTEVNTNEF